MAYTARELIAQAYYLSGIASAEFQNVTPFQFAEGLIRLNRLLDFYAAQSKLIPYYSSYDFSGVQNQEEYFIPGLILSDSLVFTWQTVRYSMERLDRKAYFAVARSNRVFTLPYVYTIQRTGGGSNVFMYPFPNEEYDFTIQGKFSLSEVTFDTVLIPDIGVNAVMGSEFVTYLEYALAAFLCEAFNYTFLPQNQKRLATMEKNIFQMATPDLSVTKQSSLNDGYQLNYAIANIGMGYLPGG